ncbi:MAG TPA: hypothetical protein VLS89_19565 [Candidatus Nanopelagicales bacterium]|nr:hypothetical protein [Candidatus Nanopelagicales bacterium]
MRTIRIPTTVLACAITLSLWAPRAALAQDEDTPAAPAQPASPPEPSAEEIEIARQTARDGLSAYKAADYAKAANLFEKARSLYPSAQILRMAGYSHLALQRWEQAVEALEAALASQITPLSPEDRKDVEDQLEKAFVHFGRVMVTTSAKGAELLVDDDPPRALPLAAPIRLLEGGHHFVVRAPGHKDAVDDVVIEGGKEVEIKLEPVSTEVAPPPPPPPSPEPVAPPPSGFQGVRLIPAQREIGLGAAGTGLALGITAVVTALAGADLRSNVEQDVAIHQDNFGQSCERGDYRLCVFDRAVINQDADQADALRDTSLVLGISGGALFAVGATLFLIAPDGPLASKPTEPARAGKARPRLGCGPLLGGLSCSGSF